MMKRILLSVFLLICLSLPAQAQWLQEDTATSVTVWLFNTADSTPKTGVTVTTITVRYVKSDGTTASFSPTASSGSNDMVEKGNGAYFLELTAAQLDTAGPFELGCSVSGGVCAPTSYQILPTASYQLLAGGNVASTADAWNVAASSVTAGIGLQIKTNLDLPVSSAGGVITSGVAQAGGANTITLAATAPVVSLANKKIVLTLGTGLFQSGTITAYDTSTKVATVTDSATGGNWTVQPASGTYYVVHDASVGALVDNIITASKIAAGAITSSEAPNLDAAITSRLAPTVSGRTLGVTTGGQAGVDFSNINGTLDAAEIGADAITAAKIAADAGAEIAGLVWDVVLSGHLTGGTTGAALNAAGAAGDPWSTALPGAYGAGTAGRMVADMEVGTSGTAQAGGNTSITLAAGASATANFYKDKRVLLVTGTGAGQSAIVTAYDGGTKVATIFCEGSATGAWFTNPTGSTTYLIVARNRQ